MTALTIMQTLGLMVAAHLVSRPEGRLRSCRKLLQGTEKYLRFAFQGGSLRVQQTTVWLPLSPRTLSRCVATALQPLRDHGMRVY